jgi:hypothetical protein
MSELVLPPASSFMASTLRFLVVTLSSKLASSREFHDQGDNVEK